MLEEREYKKDNHFLSLPKGGLGCLDEPILEDPSQQQKSKLLGIAYGGKTYPNAFTYRTITGVNFNQMGGTCFFATACNFCKTIVWAWTGKKLAISAQEIYNIAKEHGQADTGGYHGNCVWLLEYTGSNECIKEFQTICKSCGVTTSNLTSGSTASTQSQAITTLNEYGPFYWGHHCSFYSGHEYGYDNHAILGIGYDKDRFYWKGSWTSREIDSQSGFGSCTWEEFQEYGYNIGRYNAKLLKML